MGLGAGGFFSWWQVGDDPEWDVEYDYSRFESVSTGHPDERTAHDSWQGANPGGYTVYHYADSPDMCEQYDAMAAECPEQNFWPRW